MIRHLFGIYLCRVKGWHQTGTRRTGLCERCGCYVYSNGSAHR